jgi:hypothetical protein
MTKHLYVLALCALLGACATAPIQQSASELAPTHGYVYVNLPKGGSGTFLTLRSLSDQKKYTLLARNDPGANAYGFWVLAGEYEVYQWGAELWGPYPSVTVKPGQITDLGSLVQISLGGYEFVMLPLQVPEFSHHVEAAVSEYRSVLSTTTLIEWQPSAPPQPMIMRAPATGLGLIGDLLIEYSRRVNKPSLNSQLKAAKTIPEFLAIAKTAATPLVDDVASDGPGTLYYPADYGQIRVRNAAGEWSAIDTGTLHRLTAAEYVSGRLVAGAHDGSIRISEDGGKTWRKAASVPNNDAVIDIDRVGSRWFVMAAHPSMRFGLEMTDRLSLYVSESDDFSGLKLLKEATTDPNLVALNFQGERAEAVGNYYFVLMSPALLRLDLNTMELRDISPPVRMDGFRTSRTSNLITAWRQQGMFSKLFVSSDFGDSWREYDAPPYIIHQIYFETPSDGRAVRMAAGAFTGTLEMFKYDSSKNNWTKTHEAPRGCNFMFHDDAGIARFCITAGGSILSYVDDKWSMEFSAE